MGMPDSDGNVRRGCWDGLGRHFDDGWLCVACQDEERLATLALLLVIAKSAVVGKRVRRRCGVGVVEDSWDGQVRGSATKDHVC